jgi:hypothetical protein
VTAGCWEIVEEFLTRKGVELTDEERDGLQVASSLIDYDVPVIVCKPAMKRGHWDPEGGSNDCGYVIGAWKKAVANPHVLKLWRPGMALAVVTGHLFDGADVDPRSGGQKTYDDRVTAGTWPRHYGHQETPSGGFHHLIERLDVGCLDGVEPGLDVKGGLPDGEGQGLLWIAPTKRRSKVDGVVRPYRWVVKPALDDLRDGIADGSGADLAQTIRQKRTAQPEATEATETTTSGMFPTSRDNPHQGKIPAGKRDSAMRDYAWLMVVGKRHTREEARLLVAKRWEYCAQPPEADHHYPREEALKKVDSAIRRAPEARPDNEPPTTATAVETGDQGDLVEEAFWTRRESLKTLHGWARAQGASPWAVLGVALARTVVAAAPPRVVLPAVIGGEASLNLFVALVSASGGGKGIAARVAEAALVLPEDVYTHNVGSGEGLVKVFARKEKRKGPGDEDGYVQVQNREAAMFDVSEVDTIASQNGRVGSNLKPTLRSAWSGEHLGFAYADPTKEVGLPAHSYRLCLMVGVQPKRAGELLNDSDGGTPQRFVWLPTEDPSIPDDPPPVPEQWKVPNYPWVYGHGGRTVLQLPEVVSTTIRQEHIKRMRGQGDALDGHAILCRVKVAAALMLLDGRDLVMTEEDWDLAGQIMAKSEQTRATVQAELNRAATANARNQGALEGTRTAVAEDVVHSAGIRRVKAGIRKRLDREWKSVSELRRSTARRDRLLFEEALDELVADGDADVAEVEGGRRARLGR